MNKLLVLAAPFLLSACAVPFSYGTVPLPQGKTVEQRSIAILFCKDEAKQANEGGPAAAEYLLGASLVGLPAGVQMEIDTKRAAFNACMTRMGYQVRPPV